MELRVKITGGNKKLILNYAELNKITPTKAANILLEKLRAHIEAEEIINENKTHRRYEVLPSK